MVGPSSKPPSERDTDEVTVATAMCGMRQLCSREQVRRLTEKDDICYICGERIVGMHAGLDRTEMWASSAEKHDGDTELARKCKLACAAAQTHERRYHRKRMIWNSMSVHYKDPQDIMNRLQKGKKRTKHRGELTKVTQNDASAKRRKVNTNTSTDGQQEPADANCGVTVNGAIMIASLQKGIRCSIIYDPIEVVESIKALRNVMAARFGKIDGYLHQGLENHWRGRQCSFPGPGIVDFVEMTDENWEHQEQQILSEYPQCVVVRVKKPSVKAKTAASSSLNRQAVERKVMKVLARAKYRAFALKISKIVDQLTQTEYQDLVRRASVDTYYSTLQEFFAWPQALMESDDMKGDSANDGNGGSREKSQLEILFGEKGKITLTPDREVYMRALQKERGLRPDP